MLLIIDISHPAAPATRADGSALVAPACGQGDCHTVSTRLAPYQHEPEPAFGSPCAGVRGGMAISPDLSDPLDDAKGGISLWGRWLQDRDEQVVLKLRVATGTKGRAVRVDFKSASLKVAVNAEVCMDGTLSAQAPRRTRLAPGPRGPRTSHRQVLPDECEWQLDDDAEGGRELVVTLRKASPGWWDRVLQQACQPPARRKPYPRRPASRLSALRMRPSPPRPLTSRPSCSGG